jgi:heme ABC exporter ATP-binding subunit CcmA
MTDFPEMQPIKNECPLLSVRDLQKNFGYRQVLKGVTFTLSAGQCMLLVGKNGAGKSTLVQILAGLMRPLKGEVFFKGASVAEAAALYRQSFGLITHQTLFYNDLTARENLLFFGKLRKIAHLKQKTEEVLAEIGLADAADLPVKAFSSGMGKRLNIARIMMADPDIIFLDEPYSGLDVDSILQLNSYLDRFKQKGGSILLISHQIDTCFSCCDYVAVLKGGKISRLIAKDAIDPADLLRQFQTN